LLEQQPQDEQAVAQGARHHDGVQSGELIGDEVVVGDAAASAKVFRIGAGMDSTARRHEADAVGRGHLATSPDVGDRQSVLCRHDSGVGCGDGLGPDEVLADPGQPGTAERWLVGADHRLEADVAGLGDQRTTEAGSELFDTRIALADMSEGVGKARAGGDLQHDVRQVDPRHPCRDGGLQGGEAGRPLDLVERAQHQFVTAIPALDPGRWIT
jgi:hypothetical protein